MSEQRKKRKISPDGLERVRQANRKFWANASHRRRRTRSISKAVTEAWKDPIKREKFVEASRRKWADPLLRKRMIEAQLRPETQERRLAAARSPKVRQAKSEASRHYWSDPEARKKQGDAMRRRWADPEARKRRSDAMRRRWADPEARKRQGDAIRQAMSNPRVRRRYRDASRRAMKNPETRQRIGLASKRAWAKRTQELAELRAMKLSNATGLGGIALPPDRKGKEKPGPKPQPENRKTYYIVGAEVEAKIPSNHKHQKYAIVAARRSVAEARHFAPGVVAQYHKKFRRLNPV